MRLVAALAIVLLLAGCAQAPAKEASRPAEIAVPAIEGRDTLRQGYAMTMAWSYGFPAFSADFALDAVLPGDGYAWALDVDGDKVADYNGTKLPATLSHVYRHGGRMDVTFVVATQAGRASDSHQLEVPHSVDIPGFAGNFVQCVSDASLAPAGQPTYAVHVPIDGAFGLPNPAPPAGSVFQFRTEDEPWQSAPMEGRKPEAATAFRLCPPAGWPLAYDYNVTFTLD